MRATNYNFCTALAIPNVCLCWTMDSLYSYIICFWCLFINSCVMILYEFFYQNNIICEIWQNKLICSVSRSNLSVSRGAARLMANNERSHCSHSWKMQQYYFITVLLEMHICLHDPHMRHRSSRKATIMHVLCKN